MKTLSQDELVTLFEFLVEQARERTSFKAAQLTSLIDCSTADLNDLFRDTLDEIVDSKGDECEVIPDLVRIRFRDFAALFRRKQRLFSEYELKISSNVLIYEFFMPLAREDRLREALDNLFFRDSIEQRILEIGIDRIRDGLKLDVNEGVAEIRNQVFSFFDTAVGGYSIFMVSGRYRARALLSREEALSRSPVYGPYIMDETTAVVRFIFPVGMEADTYVHGKLLEPAVPGGEVALQAERTSWLFLNFFAEAMIRVVHGEQEIWLLESGLRSAIYRWVRREDPLL